LGVKLGTAGGVVIGNLVYTGVIGCRRLFVRVEQRGVGDRGQGRPSSRKLADALGVDPVELLRLPVGVSRCSK
jgi:hypothetical protein